MRLAFVENVIQHQCHKSICHPPFIPFKFKPSHSLVTVPQLKSNHNFCCATLTINLFHVLALDKKPHRINLSLIESDHHLSHDQNCNFHFRDHRIPSPPNYAYLPFLCHKSHNSSTSLFYLYSV